MYIVGEFGNIVVEANVSQFSRVGNVCCGNNFTARKQKTHACNDKMTSED